MKRHGRPHTLFSPAQAEEILSAAERAKAIIPLCVGLSATASACARDGGKDG